MALRVWTPAEAKADALANNPDCGFAEWDNGMAFPFTLTIVVKLWRNEECFLAGDPPRRVVDGYLPMARSRPAGTES